mmetsp:Transcript_35460/g.99909  ORF Transcript_35460/g.99909 Transcript_35460/m.99909 type:complete len:237 (-) Transcript_35460:2142-2852(-)
MKPTGWPCASGGYSAGSLGIPRGMWPYGGCWYRPCPQPPTPWSHWGMGYGACMPGWGCHIPTFMGRPCWKAPRPVFHISSFWAWRACIAACSSAICSAYRKVKFELCRRQSYGRSPGSSSCRRLGLRAFRWPSMRQPCCLKWLSSAFHRGCLDSSLGLPRMTMPYLARVRATFRRRGSLRKPMPLCSLDRTHDRMMKSFSRPWKESTEATSTSRYSCWRSTPTRCMCCTTHALWPS